MNNITERWIDNLFLGPGTVTDPVIAGPREALIVPKDAQTHYIWLAAGAYLQAVEADHWWLAGKLEFFLEDSKVGEFPFCDQSRQLDIAAERTSAPRTLFRQDGDVGGSQMPTLRYQVYQGSGAIRESLAIPCFRFDVRCTRIIYRLEKSFYTLPGATNLGLFSGLRILSM